MKKLNITKTRMAMSLASACFAIAMFTSYKDGPALNGRAVTGAPFNSNRTCTQCHSGGNFGATLISRLYKSDSTIVTSYTPNQQYYFVLVFRNTTGNPLHGFQTTCATASPADVNINRWTGAPGLPLNTANRVLSARNYVEHTTPLSTDTLIIPWRAPAAGTGAVVFYTAANFVNGNNRTSGDQVVKTTLTVPETVVGLVAPETSRFEDKASYSLKLVQAHGGSSLLFYNAGTAQNVKLVYTDMQGNVVKTVKVKASEGNNVWPAQLQSFKGMIVINAITEDGQRVSVKCSN